MKLSRRGLFGGGAATVAASVAGLKNPIIKKSELPDTDEAIMYNWDEKTNTWVPVLRQLRRSKTKGNT